MPHSKTFVARPWEGCDPAGPQLRIKSVMVETGLSRSSIYKKIKEGDMPPLVKLGKRSSAMPKSWLDAWNRDRVSRQTK